MKILLRGAILMIAVFLFLWLWPKIEDKINNRKKKK